MGLPAVNPPARALYADVHADPGNQEDPARFTLLDPAAHRFHPDWTRPPTSRARPAESRTVGQGRAGSEMTRRQARSSTGTRGVENSTILEAVPVTF